MLAKARTENFHPLSFSVCIRFLVLLYHRSPFGEALFPVHLTAPKLQLGKIRLLLSFRSYIMKAQKARRKPH